MLIYEAAEFGMLARARREHLGLSQAALAEAAGRTQTWVSAMETGGVTPKLDSVLLICNALDMVLDIGSNPGGTA